MISKRLAGPFLGWLMTLCGTSGVTAQPADSLSPWKHSVVGAFTFTQVSYSDWAQGGQNALAYAVALEGQSDRDAERTNWSNSYKFAFGQTRLGDQGLRKTDDKIDLQTVFTYKLGTHINPYVSATLKTQFAEGLKYDKEGLGTAVSRFFDPAYLTQAAGVGYQPIPELKTRLGLAIREILTSTYTAYSDDPATASIEKTKVDGGFEWISELSWKIEENVLLTSKLELFSPVKRLEDFVVRGDNTLAVKVSKYIVINLNVQFINEKAVTPRTQVKETLAFGLSYALL
jgi:hypothetical protein